MKKRKLIFLFVVSCMCVLGACSQKPKEQETDVTVSGTQESSIAYRTINPSYEDIIQEEDINFTYRQSTQYDLSFGIANRIIENMDLERGQMVKKGQLLASLDLGDLEKQISVLQYDFEKSSLQLKQAEEQKALELESAYILYTYGKMEKKDKDELSQKQEQIENQYFNTLQTLKDQADVAETRLQEAKEQLEKGRIYSPVTGEVTYVLNTENWLWDARNSQIGETVLTISELSDCYFSSQKLEYMDCFEEGASYEIKCADSGIYTYYNITPINPGNWESEGEMKFTLTDKNQFVRLSTMGTVTINLGEKKHVMCLPQGAVHKAGDKNFVYVLEHGMRQVQYVETGLTVSGKTEIVSGLTEEDAVIVEQAIADPEELLNQPEEGEAEAEDNQEEVGEHEEE